VFNSLKEDAHFQAQRKSLTGSSLSMQNNKQEGKIYEKGSLNCIGGNWVGFRSRTAF
jgi:hypothetical protein